MDQIFKAILDDEAVQYGIKMGRLYTDHGLPVDMSLSMIDAPKDRKLAVLHGVCEWLLQHKRNSGAGEKAIDRQRQQNNKIIFTYINTGESGLY